MKPALTGAGQIAGHQLACLKDLSGLQDAGYGILVREGRFEASDASQRIAPGSI
jgi:hypothetical protein